MNVQDRGRGEGDVTRVDLAIRNGRVVTAGTDGVADIGIVGERIVQIGGDMEAHREIDAGGMLVFPGGVDAHVHLSQPPSTSTRPRWVDNFTTGSAAALAGGITTVGNMSNPAEGETPFDTLEREGAWVERDSIADVFLHPILGRVTGDTLEQIPRLLPEWGVNSIKIFLVTPTFDAETPAFLKAMESAGQNGMISCLHCEDFAVIETMRTRLFAQGRGSIRYYAESAPVVSETVAVERAVAFCEVTGCPIYVVHLSSQRALAVCAAAQARGLPVYVETRPLYLHLTVERFAEPDGAKYVGQPPLRESGDVEALWDGLRAGTVHTVCSDHAPYGLSAKLDPELTVARPRAGVENLQTLMPMLFSEGVRAGHLSLSRFVEVTSTNAAKLFGLYPRKGTIAPGSDADLTIFDPEMRRTVTNDMLFSATDYSVYEGWEVTGWPMTTIRRGEIVYTDGAIVGQAGSGRLLRSGPVQPL